ncbi:MAG: 23S rRNA (adenine(2503)-C(2))-methyltransferase RlmN [Planctomycetes bacterium]|nr:23S rRNA (adenine(2503)-C(2))-methyltransferase RlmN [Planctomycetota bacterium]MCB9905311.1 23S rRNA (adenine(2503)-C(2))-methyltransferase RlmN [Planctomycetota bacterium]
MSAGEESKSAPDTLLSLDKAGLAEHVVALGGKPFHGRIAREQVLKHGVTDYAAMTSLPATLREALAAELPILSSREVDRSVARDATTKLLLGFPRGGGVEATIETVHIPPSSPKSTKGATLCVSSQVGCPVACPFCASGRLGLVRNLAAHEILEQYVRGRALGDLSRSVVMGIGEPLLNFENLTTALDAVHDEMGLGTRRITVSTVGFPDRLRRAAESRPRFQLAISLHTPFDDQRDELVPAMKGTPIADVIAAADHWFDVTGREVTYEYVLLGGDNDSVDHARALADRLWGKRCTVNLIPYNPVEGDTYRRPHAEDVDSFRQFLDDAGTVATIRWSRGLEGDAACGQLRVRHA